MKAIHLQTEHLSSPFGIDIQKPVLSWLCEGGVAQTAYEVEALSCGQVIWQSGRVTGNTMHTVLDAPLSSRQSVCWRVRLWDENGAAGPWSEPAAFELGLLSPADWQAQWIDPELQHDPSVHHPASYLRKTFTVPEGKQARLYVTCYGLYEAWLNGQRVGNFVLAPGSYTYEKRIAYQTYDVTAQLHPGENEIQVILGDGWYRSCAGIDGKRNLYGKNIALLLQLEVDGQPVCLSDESWQATQQGPLRENDMQQGEVYDARVETLDGWHPVGVEAYGYDALACANSLPIAERERFAGTLITTPNGETVIDYGQNLAGYVEFELDAHTGQKIILTHGETLDEHGNFTNANFQDDTRHQEGGIRQQIIYTCKEGRNHYKARFTIFGFRYAKVETDIDLNGAKFTAIAVYSDMEDVGSFACSNADVNQLFHNSVWSMKSNFCDVPTDCPTRERAAWTGDMGVFIETGLYLADCYPIVRKWLAECRLNQYPGGQVAVIAPHIDTPSPMLQLISGSVGWGDACILVPWALYRRNGDVRILKENYLMMQRWYGFLEGRARRPGGALPQDHPLENYLIDTVTDFGEWMEPDASDVYTSMAQPQTKVATAYFAHSGRILARIAELLDHPEDAAHYREVSEKAAQAFRLVATEDGAIHSERQADYLRPIAFGLLTENEAKAAAAELDRKIAANGYHLNTGFLSTPLLCQVLADYGHLETAYRLLLQDTMPSWLYAVKRGATTIWERWDGIDPNGHPQGSLNHYSYGAVCAWLFCGVCGIRVEGNTVTIRPQPYPALEYARARYRSPLGEIVSGWRYEDGQPRYEIVLPANVTAAVELADGRRLQLEAGTHWL